MVQIKLSTAFVLAAATIASVVALPITSTPPPPASTAPLASEGSGLPGSQMHGGHSLEVHGHYGEGLEHPHGTNEHVHSLLAQHGGLGTHGYRHEELHEHEASYGHEGPHEHEHVDGSHRGLLRRQYVDGLVVRDLPSAGTPAVDATPVTATSEPGSVGQPSAPAGQPEENIASAAPASQIAAATQSHPGTHEEKDLHGRRPGSEGRRGHHSRHHHHHHPPGVPANQASLQGDVKSVKPIRRRAYSDIEDMFRRSMEDLEFDARGFEDEFYLD